jgi:hypothetical protein
MFRMKTKYSEFNNKHFNAHYISHLTNSGLAHKSVWVPAGQGQEY